MEDIDPVPLPALERLAGVMHRLRAPGGCPWDAEQTEQTLKKHLLEETYELLEAIDHDEPGGLCEELGDVLLQVVFQAEIARERGRFDLDDVGRGVAEKLVRRHPHVFGSRTADDAQAAIASWEDIKRQEREQKGKAGQESPPSALDGVPRQLPALLAAFRTSQKAAAVGFDWPDVASVWDKVEEELGELREVAEPSDTPGNREAVAEELGDLLFVLTNLARKLDVDPEDALRAATTKFGRRFRGVEARLHAQGKTPAASDLDELDGLWNDVKQAERAGPGAGQPTRE